VGPHSSIHDLARRLKLEGIGAAVVSQDGQRVDGIVSEREIVRSLAEHGARLLDKPVSDIMLMSVVTCTAEDSVKEVMRRMTRHRVRHLPVLEDGRLAGIVSIGDVVKSRLDEMELEANVLRDYSWRTSSGRPRRPGRDPLSGVTGAIRCAIAAVPRLP
jgi:signal-transduction protein with cAMP-binding, CBS, and nucleotidyltransferase domain